MFVADLLSARGVVVSLHPTYNDLLFLHAKWPAGTLASATSDETKNKTEIPYAIYGFHVFLLYDGVVFDFSFDGGSQTMSNYFQSAFLLPAPANIPPYNQRKSPNEIYMQNVSTLFNVYSVSSYLKENPAPIYQGVMAELFQIASLLKMSDQPQMEKSDYFDSLPAAAVYHHPRISLAGNSMFLQANYPKACMALKHLGSYSRDSSHFGSNLKSSIQESKMLQVYSLIKNHTYGEFINLQHVSVNFREVNIMKSGNREQPLFFPIEKLSCTSLVQLFPKLFPLP